MPATNPPPPLSTLLLTAAEVAVQLRISLRLLQYQVKSGRFPIQPIRLGRAVRYRADELERWVSAGSPAAERWRAMHLARRAG